MNQTVLSVGKTIICCQFTGSGGHAGKELHVRVILRSTICQPASRSLVSLSMLIPLAVGSTCAVASTGTVPTITKYVYVLRLRNGIRYVGSTQSLAFRLWEHFSLGGAIATRESLPVRVEQLFDFEERWHHNGANLLRLEAYIASIYADRYGSQWIRGASHGYGRYSGPSSADRRFVRRTRIFFQTKAGRTLWAAVRRVDPCPYQPI